METQESVNLLRSKTAVSEDGDKAARIISGKKSKAALWLYIFYSQAKCVAHNEVTQLLCPLVSSCITCSTEC